MSRKSRFITFKILKVVSFMFGVACVYFILGSAGTSDFETMVDSTVLHSDWWFIKMILIGAACGGISYVINYIADCFKFSLRRKVK